MTKMVKSYDTKIVGQKIKALRKARSLTQDALSEPLGGLSRSQISNIETGRRNISLPQVKALADFFNVSLDVLGLSTDEIETSELLARATLIFKNEDVPLEEKQELAEMIYSMYLDVKQQIKDK